jgi:hypothetical protein
MTASSDTCTESIHGDANVRVAMTMARAIESFVLLVERKDGDLWIVRRGKEVNVE